MKIFNYYGAEVFWNAGKMLNYTQISVK
jgi:hypothetical protein